MKTLRFRSVPPMAPVSSSHSAVKGTRGLVSAMAVAAMLAVGGCSTVEDTWDSTWDTVFGDEEPVATEPGATEQADTPVEADTDPESDMTESAPLADGLVAAPHRAYDESVTRRAPTDRHALVETPAEPSSAKSSSAESQVAAAQAPAIPSSPTKSPAPQATDTVPMTAASGDALTGASAETMQPRSLASTASDGRSGGAGSSGLLIAPQDAYDGGAAVNGMETTVINGDGTVSVEPSASVDYVGGAQGPDGVYVDGEGYSGPHSMHAFDPTGSGVSTLVATIQFGYGSAYLGAHDRKVLRQVVALQKRYGGSVRVVGHASSRTANMTMERHNTVNFATSVARADSVAETLAGMGVPREMIYSAAVSDNEPVYYEVMPSGEAGNRRTDIYLDY